MNATQITNLIERARATGRHATHQEVRIAVDDDSIHVHISGESSPELLAAIDEAASGFTFSHTVADSGPGAYAETLVYVRTEAA